MTNLLSSSLFFLFSLSFYSAYSQFGPQQVLDSNLTAGITEIHLSDLNNDNFKDIIVSQKFNVNNSIVYYQNAGNGTFNSPQTLASNISHPPSVTSGDLNGDNWMDIISISKYDSTLLWQENNSGTFSFPTLIDSTIFEPTDVKIGDIDNDSDLDIVCTGDIELIVYKNDGLGTFTKHSVPHGISTEYYDLTLNDIDNDGFLDVIVGGVRTLIYKNTNGILAFDTVRTYSINDNSLSFLVETEDLNNDGHLDLVINGHSQSDLRWYENDGNGFFSLAQIFEPNTTHCSSIALKDFDNDGDIDVFTAHDQTGKVVWYINSGNGVFSSAYLIHQGTLPYPNRVAAGDLNNDNKIDIVWSQELSYHLNNFTLNLEDEETPSVFTLYPNPARNIVNLNASLSGSISISNHLQQVLIKEYKINQGINSMDLNLPVGVYNIIFTSNKKTSHQTLIIK